MTAITRPVLRYHGGKFRLAPWVLSHFPKHAIYVEPYSGAASVLLQKERVAAEVYNDLDGNVVNLFRVLRDPAKALELQRRVALTPFAREEFEWSYQPPEDDIDAAHKLIIRSFLGRGSDAATRSCRSGFTTLLSEGRALPAYAFSAWSDAIPTFTARLRGVVIENGPAIDIIKRFDTPNTLIYADPPYLFSTRSSLKGRSKKSHGYKHEMTDDDHAELASVLHGIKGMALISGYHSALYKELYAGWRCCSTKAVAEGGKVRTEAIWINPAAQEAMACQTSQQHLFMDATA